VCSQSCINENESVYVSFSLCACVCDCRTFKPSLDGSGRISFQEMFSMFTYLLKFFTNL